MVSRSLFNQVQTRANASAAEAIDERKKSLDAELLLLQTKRQSQEKASQERSTASKKFIRMAERAGELKEERDVITERSKQLMFQMSIKDTKFRATIDQIKKLFPSQDAKFDQIVDSVDQHYEGEKAKEWREGRRIYTDSLYETLMCEDGAKKIAEILKKPPSKRGSTPTS